VGSRSWRWRNLARFLGLTLATAIAGTLVGELGGGRVGLAEVADGALVSVIIFSPIIFLVGVLPVLIFNRLVSNRLRPTRRAKVAVSSLVFVLSSLLLIAMLVLDGKEIGAGHAAFVISTFLLGAVFGTIAEAPSSGDNPAPLYLTK
jgi:hypothetical protein